MGLFNKGGKKSKGVSDYKLPELPDLPEFPSVDSPPGSSAAQQKDSLPQLPSFPTSQVGKKFSQDSIKQAVTGKKEVVEEEKSADDFTLPGLPEKPEKPVKPPMMHEPLKPVVSKGSEEIVGEVKAKPNEFHKEIKSMMTREEMIEPEPKPFRKPSRVYSGASARDEPVFIRIDKFEESLKVFEKTREQIKEIEDLVRHAKDLKVKEEEELIKWEEEIQAIKEQIDKVDGDIFSKIE